MRAHRIVAFFLPLVASAACDGTPATPGDDPQPASVAITPANAMLDAIDDTVRFSAQALDSDGGAVNGATFTWSVPGPAIVSVDAQGLVTALGAGATTVQATLDGTMISDDAAVSVEQRLAEVRVAGMPDSLIVGETHTLTASAHDANGHPLAVLPAFAWSSTNEDVATVSEAGLVTAIESGVATIRATSAGETGEDDLTVRRPNVDVAGDTALAGMVEARALVIAAGVTVTLDDSVTFDVEEDAVIGGAIAGDCTPLRLLAGGAVEITGSIDNACSDSTATGGDVTIAGAGTVVVDGDILTSGGVYITNDTSLTDDDFPPMPPLDEEGAGAAGSIWTPRGIGPATAWAAEGECRLNGAAIGPSNRVWTSDEPDAGKPGGDAILRCAGDILLTDVTMIAQDGQWGRSETVSSQSFASARGEAGGAGGSIRIEATGMVVTEATFLIGGRGGDGGRGRATGESPGGTPERAAGAEGFGGPGGPAGDVRIIGLTGGVTGAPTITFRIGGSGGEGSASGADGLNATESMPAQAGGHATAVGGRGGSGPTPGRGGTAVVSGGRGGDGGPSFPDGAAGGSVSATGGRGGRAREAEGSALAAGGAGGHSLLFDGNGGNGYGSCDPAVEQGGNGGRGGTVSGARGLGGPGASDGPFGDLNWITVGNGGNGGAGLTPGAGGDAGTDDTEDEPSQVTDPSLQAGDPGETCVTEPEFSMSLDPTSVSGTHTTGVSSCPQFLGVVWVSNDGEVEGGFMVDPPTGFDVSPRTQGTIGPGSGLEPGGSAGVDVEWTCELSESTTGNIEFQLFEVGGDRSTTADLEVTVTVE